jgi:hypothetical protein
VGLTLDATDVHLRLHASTLRICCSAECHQRVAHRWETADVKREPHGIAMPCMRREDGPEDWCEGCGPAARSQMRGRAGRRHRCRRPDGSGARAPRGPAAPEPGLGDCGAALLLPVLRVSPLVRVSPLLRGESLLPYSSDRAQWATARAMDPRRGCIGTPPGSGTVLAGCRPPPGPPGPPGPAGAGLRRG